MNSAFNSINDKLSGINISKLSMNETNKEEARPKIIIPTKKVIKKTTKKK